MRAPAAIAVVTAWAAAVTAAAGIAVEAAVADAVVVDAAAADVAVADVVAVDVAAAADAGDKRTIDGEHTYETNLEKNDFVESLPDRGSHRHDRFPCFGLDRSNAG